MICTVRICTEYQLIQLLLLIIFLSEKKRRRKRISDKQNIDFALKVL